MPRAYYEVPLEELRAHYREQAEITSVRAVAEKVGLGRTTMQSFIRGETHPHPRVRRLAALAYLEKEARDAEAARGPPPPWSDPEVQLAVRVLLRAHARAGEVPPEWLTRLVAPGPGYPVGPPEAPDCQPTR